MRKLKQCIAQYQNTDEAEGENDGFTLVEVLITLAIMGMILLVVNIVLIALVRVSYDTDTRTTVRDGSEFALELMRRHVKSSEPGSVEVWDAATNTEVDEEEEGDKLHMRLAEMETDVDFWVEEVTNQRGQEVNVFVATWTPDGGTPSSVHLTSPDEINVEAFTATITNDPVTGSSEILLTIKADSANMKNLEEPVIDDVIRHAVLLTHYPIQ